MQNDDIKTFFDTFDPDLSPDFGFMKKLECNLDSVEIVKECNAAFNRRQRRAALVATIAGFIAGVAFTCLLPVFGSVLSGLEWDVLSKILDDSSMSVFSAVLGVA